MVFWKRDTAKAQSGKKLDVAEQGLFGLAESQMVGLVNAAQVVKIEPGQSLADRMTGSVPRMFLLRQGTLQMALGTCGEVFELTAGQGIDGLAAEASLLQRIQATEPAVLLCLDEGAYRQLDEQVRLALLEFCQPFSARLNALLALAADRAEARYLQLSNVLFQSMDRAAVQFAGSEAVQQVIKRIPKLPVSSIDLLNRLLDETSTHAQVAELVLQDPALSALLLKAINSPGYSFGQGISDVSHAISLLGFEGVYQLIMAESLRKSLPDSEKFRNSYQRALMLSYIAYALSQATGKGRPAEISTMALLHDLGRVVIALLVRQNPSFKGVIKQVHPGVVGAQLLKAWQLPETVWRAIEVQHYPEFVMPEQLARSQRTPAALMYLSGWMLDYLQGQAPSALFVEEYQAVLGMKPTAAEACWEQVLKPRLRQRRNALPDFLRSRVDQS